MRSTITASANRLMAIGLLLIMAIPLAGIALADPCGMVPPIYIQDDTSLVLKQAYADGGFGRTAGWFLAHGGAAGPCGLAGVGRIVRGAWQVLSGLGVAADRSSRTPASQAAC